MYECQRNGESESTYSVELFTSGNRVKRRELQQLSIGPTENVN